MATVLSINENGIPLHEINGGDPQETEKEFRMSPVYFLLMIFEAFVVYLAYSNGDYVTAVVSLLIIVGIASWMFGFPDPSSMTDNQRIWAMFTLWFLPSAIVFGYAYQYQHQHVVSLAITVVMYASASVFSALLACLCVTGVVYVWKSRSSGEHGTGDVENQKLDAGELKPAADSSLEKV